MGFAYDSTINNDSKPLRRPNYFNLSIMVDKNENTTFIDWFED